MMRRITLILWLVLLAGCRTFEIGFVQTPTPDRLRAVSTSTLPLSPMATPDRSTATTLPIKVASLTPATSPNSTPTMLPTSTATVAPVPTKLWPPDTTNVLPAPLYFLSDLAGNQQIWRVETDGVRLTQITSLPHPVDVFDISRVTGRIAYVSGNRLVTSDELGNDIQRIDTGDVGYRDNLSEAVASLAWSPDGTQLALAGRNGLWLYTVDSADLVQLMANPERVFGMWLDAPQAWSPDGSALLLRIMYSGSDAGDNIYVPVNAPAAHVITGLSLCYKLSWSPDSRLVYASMGVSTVLCPQPGLVRWKVDSRTITPLITSEPVNRNLSAHFVETAQEGPDGLLYYFYGSDEVPGDELRYGTLRMFRSAPDNIANRAALRDDSYSTVLEVLWTDEMSAAVIVDGSNSDSIRKGAIILLTTDNKPMRMLAERGFSLRWGRSQ